MSYTDWEALGAEEYPDWAMIQSGVDLGYLEWDTANPHDTHPHGESVNDFPHSTSLDNWLKGTGTLGGQVDYPTKTNVEAYKTTDLPPTGPTPSCARDQPLGGDVLASWTHSGSGSFYKMVIAWYANSSLLKTKNLAEGALGDKLTEAEMDNGDVIECEVKYYWGVNEGAYGTNSNQINYTK